VNEVQYPVELVVAGKRCVVVGGGSVAARKVAGLLSAGADVLVVAPVISDEIKATRARKAERDYRRSDLEGAWLVFAATDDPEVNDEVYTDGEDAHVWVNSADDPEACSFTLPAVLRRGPVTIAVSTSGHSPALAAWLKGQIADQLGPEIAELAVLLSEARDQLKAAGRSTEEVDWRPALDWDMLELIKAGQLARARERLQACLS
jgi:precorrin-2 dehydrogenase/sirohydrochlorin ferrochelatase